MQAHSVRLISRVDPIKYLMSKSCLVGERQNGLFCCKSLISPTSLKKLLRDKHLQIFLQIIQYQMIGSSLKIFLMKMCFSLKYRDHENCSLMELLEKMERGRCYPRHSKKKVLPYAFTLVENCSSNIAEYQALTMELEVAIELKISRLKVFGNSKLIINQLLTFHEVKKPKLYHMSIM